MKFFLSKRRQDTSLVTRIRAKVCLDVTVRASNRLHEFPIIRCTLLGKFVLPYSSMVASGNGNWISCKNRYRVAFDQRNSFVRYGSAHNTYVCRIKFQKYICKLFLRITSLIQLNLICLTAIKGKFFGIMKFCNC